MAIRTLDHVNFITHNMAATVEFYCDVIGLVLDEQPDSMNSLEWIYLCIPGQKTAILHIGNAKNEKFQTDYERFADLDETNAGQFSTGSFDHFCLSMDDKDYQPMLEKLKTQKINYQTYCHTDTPLKQIWILDPNGVRVELNFSNPD